MSEHVAGGDSSADGLERWWERTSVRSAIVAVLAVIGSVLALCTATALYLSGWDFRPQDRPEGHWQAIVGLGTSGFILAGGAVSAALLLLLLMVPRWLRLGRSDAIVGPFAVVLVSMALVVFAAHIGLPVIGQANYLVEHPDAF